MWEAIPPAQLRVDLVVLEVVEVEWGAVWLEETWEAVGCQITWWEETPITQHSEEQIVLGHTQYSSCAEKPCVTEKLNLHSRRIPSVCPVLHEASTFYIFVQYSFTIMLQLLFYFFGHLTWIYLLHTWELFIVVTLLVLVSSDQQLKKKFISCSIHQLITTFEGDKDKYFSHTSYIMWFW